MAKACVLTTHRLFYAMDKVSKNAWMDVVTDRARAELGEDASDDAIAERHRAKREDESNGR